MEMIQTEKLVYEYEKRDEEGNVIGTSRAIDEVDIEAKEGQFIAVLGHNGSGKSTLAKHLNAILVPTEGSVWVNGNWRLTFTFEGVHAVLVDYQDYH